MNILVSVIIPTFKRTELLQRSLESVLNQSYSFFEILIIDNNEPNSQFEIDTKKICSKYNDARVNYIKSSKFANVQFSRNLGIHFSKGEYICFLDNDDVFLPDKLKKQIYLLSKSTPDVIGIYSGFNLVKSNKVYRSCNFFKQGDLTDSLLLQEFAFCAGSTLMLKNQIIKENNFLFEEDFKIHQDWIFLIQIMKNYNLISSNEILVNINKDDSSGLNFDEENLINGKLKYLTLINSYIKHKPIELQNKILQIQYFHLATILATKNKHQNVFNYLKIANSYKKLSIIQKLKILIKFLTSII